MQRYKDYLDGYAIKSKAGYLFSEFRQQRKELIRWAERELSPFSDQPMAWTELKRLKGYQIVKVRLAVQGQSK